jgi:hypothetical protein
LNWFTYEFEQLYSLKSISIICKIVLSTLNNHTGRIIA